MKKFASFIMVLVMLASILAVGTSAAQTNMEVTAPKFSAQPIFDGCVSEAEWGAATVHMVTEGAATVDDVEIGVNEEFGLRNTFYWTDDPENGYTDSLSYDLWLRWDETYLYLAAIVNDPNPFANNNSGDGIWNGDCVQFRFDEKGPSGIMLTKDPDFNYKTDEFMGSRYAKPWSSDKNNLNCLMALAGGTNPTLWRGTSDTIEGYDMVEEKGGKIGITYTDGAEDTCVIQYEAAIPWSTISDTFVPKANTAYGMSLSVACADSGSLNAWLQWGHGVMTPPDGQPKGTRGGSQAVILSEETIAPEEGHPIATTAGSEVTEDDTIDDIPAPGPLPTPGTTTAGTGNNAADGTQAGTKAPNQNTDDKDDADGLPTAAIIAIAAAAVVVVAVVVIVIVKKKK